MFGTFVGVLVDDAEVAVNIAPTVSVVVVLTLEVVPFEASVLTNMPYDAVEHPKLYHVYPGLPMKAQKPHFGADDGQ